VVGAVAVKWPELGAMGEIEKSLRTAPAAPLR
jgi:hypothetical protein